jgi:hypothetical protein
MRWRHLAARIVAHTGAWVGVALLATSSACAIDHALLATLRIESAQPDAVAGSNSATLMVPSVTKEVGKRWIELSLTDTLGAKAVYRCLVKADIFNPDIIDVPVPDMLELDRLIVDLPCSNVQVALVPG